MRTTEKNNYFKIVLEDRFAEHISSIIETLNLYGQTYEIEQRTYNSSFDACLLLLGELGVFQGLDPQPVKENLVDVIEGIPAHIENTEYELSPFLLEHAKIWKEAV